MDQILIDLSIIGIFVESVKEVVEVDVSGVNGDSGGGMISLKRSLEMLGKSAKERFTVV